MRNPFKRRAPEGRRSVTVYVGGHMHALVQSPRPLTPYSYGNTTIGGSVQRTPTIGPEADLFDLLSQHAGRRVRVTATVVPDGR